MSLSIVAASYLIFRNSVVAAYLGCIKVIDFVI
jgi:hypothetical protein